MFNSFKNYKNYSKFHKTYGKGNSGKEFKVAKRAIIKDYHNILFDISNNLDDYSGSFSSSKTVSSGDSPGEVKYKIK